MSGGRVGGPVCGGDGEWATTLRQGLEDGTLMRWLAPAPRPVNAAPLATWVDPADLQCPLHLPDVSHLFNSCREPQRGLGDAAFAQAAADLGIDIARIRAVAEVESPSGPFDDAGRPTILFERHYFHRLTGGKHSKAHPDISSAQSGGYGKYRVQYDKLERAYKLAPGAALQSASWGRFQVMGEHYALLGYPSPQHMVQAFAASEEAHLKGFVQFVKAHPAMLKALQQEDWAGFARRYNGPGYKKNDYDTKLAEAYRRYKAAEAPAPAAPPGSRGGGGAAVLPQRLP